MPGKHTLIFAVNTADGYYPDLALEFYTDEIDGGLTGFSALILAALYAARRAKLPRGHRPRI
jgi:hypothetical protein